MQSRSSRGRPDKPQPSEPLQSLSKQPLSATSLRCTWTVIHHFWWLRNRHANNSDDNKVHNRRKQQERQLLTLHQENPGRRRLWRTWRPGLSRCAEREGWALGRRLISLPMPLAWIWSWRWNLYWSGWEGVRACCRETGLSAFWLSGVVSELESMCR